MRGKSKIKSNVTWQSPDPLRYLENTKGVTRIAWHNRVPEESRSAHRPVTFTYNTLDREMTVLRTMIRMSFVSMI
jgi:hypothetical protein